MGQECKPCVYSFLYPAGGGKKTEAITAAASPVGNGFFKNSQNGVERGAAGRDFSLPFRILVLFMDGRDSTPGIGSLSADDYYGDS